MRIKDRNKTHWCTVNKHNKCGSLVCEIIRLGGQIKLEDLKEDNFHYYKCRCFCHYESTKRYR